MGWHPLRWTYIGLVVGSLLWSVGCGSATPAGPDGPECSDHATSPSIQPGSGEKCKEIESPVLLHCVDPMYPTQVRRARIEGKVVVKAVLTAAGNLEDLTVESSDSGQLTALALAAFRERRYKPARCRESGEAVGVYVTMTANFKLGGKTTR